MVNRHELITSLMDTLKAVDPIVEWLNKNNIEHNFITGIDTDDDQYTFLAIEISPEDYVLYQMNFEE